jgi:phage FluMu protein Com
MKPKDEIEKLADNWSDDYEKGANRDIAKRSYIAGYTQCEEDMVKQEEVDVICPKCKGVNEYFISEKGDYTCAYTDCQHKFKQD